MQPVKNFFERWGWSVLMMGVIFAFSAASGKDLPNFGSVDYWIKKGSHMLGYGLLALTYWHGLGRDRKRWGLPWLLAVLYAVTDEFHQSFIAGRHPSPIDVFLFDGGGAGLALMFTHLYPDLTNR
jgi:VanZ family protein